MSTTPARKLTRLQVGALPLIRSILARLHLREILLEHIPSSERQPFPRADLLILLAVNLTLAKDPLYELAEWVDSLDLRALDYDPRPAGRLSDDRFARALDQLYEADRTSLLTRLVVSAIQVFAIRSERMHNDSTSVKACGRIAGSTKTGLELRFDRPFLSVRALILLENPHPRDLFDNLSFPARENQRLDPLQEREASELGQPSKLRQLFIGKHPSSRPSPLQKGRRRRRFRFQYS